MPLKYTCFDFVSSGERSFGDSFWLSWFDPLSIFDEESQLSNELTLLTHVCNPTCEPFCESFCELLCDFELSLQDFFTGLGFASPSAGPRGCRSFLGGTGGGTAGNSGGTLFRSIFLSALTTSGLSAPRHLTISLIISCDSFNRLTQSNRVMCVTGIPSIESTCKRRNTMKYRLDTRAYCPC